jgi:hypothetical protein
MSLLIECFVGLDYSEDGGQVCTSKESITFVTYLMFMSRPVGSAPELDAAFFIGLVHGPFFHYCLPFGA